MSTKNEKAFYKYHLGRLGVEKLNQILHPKLCFLSEFGEEDPNYVEVCKAVFNNAEDISII